MKPIDSRPITVSIIIPAYNEEYQIPTTLQTIVKYLNNQTYLSEVLVVENGSTDRTADKVHDFVRQLDSDTGLVSVSLLHSKPGKGAAVRQGMLNAVGDVILFTDCDLAVPITEMEKLVPALMGDEFAVVIASRELANSNRIGEPFHRRIMGRGFNWLVRGMALSKIQDTQCGFKGFTRSAARALFALQEIDGWGFDVEVLFIAQLHNIQISEFPVEWHYGKQSKVAPFRDTINMMTNIIQIRLNAWLGKYDLDRRGGRKDFLYDRNVHG